MKQKEFEAAYETMRGLGLEMKGKRAQHWKEFITYGTYVQNEIKPVKYLEIGARWGESLLLHSMLMPKGSSLRVIEWPEQGWGRQGSKRVLTAVRGYLIQIGYDVRIHWGNSQNPEALEFAKHHGPYDLVFIDGDHSYQGAYEDWTNYGRQANFVAFHDAGSIHEVGQVWKNIKKTYPDVPVREFIDPRGELTMGIGVFPNVNEKKHD